MSNPKEQRRPLNPEQAVDFLSDRLRTSLVLMHRGGEALIPSLVACLPRGSRLTLSSLGALAPDPDNPGDLMLTAAGRELAATCAVEGLPPRAHRVQTELEEERARRAAAGEPDSGICRVRVGLEERR
jgi:hypothetical protein